MTIGVLRAVLEIPGARSLKEKRQVLQSLLAAVRREHNVSAAEVERQDVHQAAVLAFATAGTERRHVNAALSRLAERLGRQAASRLVDYEIELF